MSYTVNLSNNKALQLFFLELLKFGVILQSNINNLYTPQKMKKLQLLLIAMMLLFAIDVKADDTINSNLDLINPDVRKCLLESSKSEGWELTTLYFNADNKLVMIFEKGENSRTYMSK